MEEPGSNESEEVVVTKYTGTVEAFSSCIIPVKAYMGEHINIMIQVLWTEDGSLLQGLTIQNAYT